MSMGGIVLVLDGDFINGILTVGVILGLERACNDGRATVLMNAAPTLADNGVLVLVVVVSKA